MGDEESFEAEYAPSVEGMIDNPAGYYSYWQSFCEYIGVNDAHMAWRMVEKPWKWRPELEKWVNDPEWFSQEAESFSADWWVHYDKEIDLPCEEKLLRAYEYIVTSHPKGGQEKLSQFLDSLGHYQGEAESFNAESKKINPIEKAGISGVASGATIEGLSALMAAEYENIGTMSVAPARGYTGYMNMMSSARRMVEIGNETGLDQKLGEAYQDESGRWFLPILERKASEDEGLSQEQLSAYFARLESQKPDLAREIEYSVKNEDELPTQKIYDAGFNPSIIEEWVDLVGVEDENLQPYESCSTCEGEGYVLTSYTSATRFDPADGDGEDCEECGGTGMIDPSDYMDKEGQYYAESFESEEKSISPYLWGLGIVGILGYAFTRKLY